MRCALVGYSWACCWWCFAIPVIVLISVGTLNAVACQQLDKFEQEYPIITKPTDEVCWLFIGTKFIRFIISVNLHFEDHEFEVDVFVIIYVSTMHEHLEMCETLRYVSEALLLLWISLLIMNSWKSNLFFQCEHVNTSVREYNWPRNWPASVNECHLGNYKSDVAAVSQCHCVMTHTYQPGRACGRLFGQSHSSAVDLDFDLLTELPMPSQAQELSLESGASVLCQTIFLIIYIIWIHWSLQTPPHNWTILYNMSTLLLSTGAPGRLS